MTTITLTIRDEHFQNYTYEETFEYVVYYNTPSEGVEFIQISHIKNGKTVHTFLPSSSIARMDVS